MPQRFEYNDVAGAADEYLYGTAWYAQSFTPQVAHIISSVKLKMFRDGLPGTLTASIRATDGNGKPTGADLCGGTVNANAFGEGSANATLQEIIFTTQTALTSGIKYAIVARALEADGNTDVGWEENTTSQYANGNSLESLDSGSTWSHHLTRDFVFEEWGTLPASLLNPGYWHSTYWTRGYWNPLYWARYGVVVPSAASPTVPSIAPPRKRKRQKREDEDVFRLFRNHLRLKVT